MSLLFPWPDHRYDSSGPVVWLWGCIAMSRPIAYFRGDWIAGHDLAVPVSDAGFLLGVTVAEQLRTFNGKIFRLDAHLDRLFRSLAIIGVDCPLDRAKLTEVAHELVEHNHKLIQPGDDLGLTVFVTPGPLHPETNQAASPTVCLHTAPIRFNTFASKYDSGESLATTNIVQVPAESWPPELKCRSRMHYYLADKQARERFPGSRALMLDQAGFVTEATTANLLVVRGGELLTPPADKVLPGISLAVVRDLAITLRISLREADLRPADVASADELLLVSTSPCVLPATTFNGQPVGLGVAHNHSMQPRLLMAWSDQVGLDIAAQAKRFATRH
jgi:branched-chain amino acid aminotransferase